MSIFLFMLAAAQQTIPTAAESAAKSAQTAEFGLQLAILMAALGPLLFSLKVLHTGLKELRQVVSSLSIQVARLQGGEETRSKG